MHDLTLVQERFDFDRITTIDVRPRRSVPKLDESRPHFLALRQYGPKSKKMRSTLVEFWNGSSWTHINSRDPNTNQSVLSDVSCTSVKSCIAVVYFGGSTGYGPLTELWNGRHWYVGKSNARLDTRTGNVAEDALIRIGSRLLMCVQEDPFQNSTRA